jgi:hypothetical protein
MLPFMTDATIGQIHHWNPLPWCTRIGSGKFVDTALVTAASEVGMLRLRACSLSIAYLRKAPFCFYRTLPKISSSPLVFGADARYSLIRIIHLHTDEVIQLRCPLVFRHHSCLSARVKVTSPNRITISPTSTPMSLATKPTEFCVSFSP